MWIDRLIGNRISAQRDASGASLQSIAERTRITASILQDYEAGKKRIQRRDLIKIARALDMSPERLLDGAETTTERRFPRVSFIRDTVRISHL